MAALDLHIQAVDDLFERLHRLGQFQIIILEDQYGGIHDVLDGSAVNFQLFLGLRGEFLVLIGHLPGIFHDIDRMVADPLEVADAVEQGGQDVAVLGAQIAAAKLHQIGAQLILVGIDQIFQLFYALGALRIVLLYQLHGDVKCFLCILGHVAGCGLTLFQCEMRGVQETLVQDLDILLGCAVLGLFLGDGQGLHGQLHQDLGNRQHDHHGCQVEYAVDHGDDERIRRLGHKREMHDGVHRIKQDHEEGGLDDAEIQMHQGRPLCIAACAHGREHGRNGCTDILTHQDRDGRADGQRAAHGNRLQDTDRGRGTLDNGRQDQTCQHTQDRIGEHGQDAGKPLIAGERLHRRGHGLHTEHQHGKADEDRADISLLFALGTHDHDDADDAEDRGEVGGL